MEELEQRYYHIRRSAIFGRGGGRRVVVKFFPSRFERPRIQTTKDRGNERGREK